MDRVWPTISNRHADRVNSAWFGQPGTLIKSYEANRTAMLRAGQHACDGSAEVVGWAFLPNGQLRAPADPFNAPALAKCLTTQGGDGEGGQQWPCAASPSRFGPPETLARGPEGLFAMEPPHENFPGVQKQFSGGLNREGAQVHLADPHHARPIRRRAARGRRGPADCQLLGGRGGGGVAPQREQRRALPPPAAPDQHHEGWPLAKESVSCRPLYFLSS